MNSVTKSPDAPTFEEYARGAWPSLYRYAYLLTGNHEPRPRQLRLVREAVGIARSLLQAGVVERLDEPDPDGRRYRLTVDLPRDFALNQELSTFALAAIELLDPAGDTFALDVVSVVEATLDDPRQVLAAQLNKAKGEAVAQMKAEGIEYEERMELLTEVTHPKPLAELLGAAFMIYRQTHPWLDEDQLKPKAVVRDPLKGHLEHVDLVAVRRGEKVTVEVPVQLTGEAAPDTLVDQQTLTLTVIADATALPDHLELSIEGKRAGSSLSAADVRLPGGTELAQDADHVIVAFLGVVSEEQLEAELA